MVIYYHNQLTNLNLYIERIFTMEAFKQILTDLIKSKTPVICNYGEEARMNGVNEHYTPFFPVIITDFKSNRGKYTMSLA